MTKTIRLGDETHAILSSLREREGMQTYEKLIRRLIVRSGAVSGFGEDPDLPKWKEEEDRAGFRG